MCGMDRVFGIFLGKPTSVEVTLNDGDCKGISLKRPDDSGFGTIVISRIFENDVACGDEICCNVVELRSCQRNQIQVRIQSVDTVDGRNPAPPGIYRAL